MLFGRPTWPSASDRLKPVRYLSLRPSNTLIISRGRFGRVDIEGSNTVSICVAQCAHFNVVLPQHVADQAAHGHAARDSRDARERQIDAGATGHRRGGSRGTTTIMKSSEKTRSDHTARSGPNVSGRSRCSTIFQLERCIALGGTAASRVTMLPWQWLFRKVTQLRKNLLGDVMAQRLPRCLAA